MHFLRLFTKIGNTVVMWYNEVEILGTLILVN